MLQERLRKKNEELIQAKTAASHATGREESKYRLEEHQHSQAAGARTEVNAGLSEKIRDLINKQVRVRYTLVRFSMPHAPCARCA